MRCLAFGLLLATVASGLAAGSVFTRLVDMAPPTSTLLMGIDLSRLTPSRSGGHVAAELLSDPDIARLLARAGLDSEQDMQQLLFAGLGQQTAGGLRGVIIARGSFDLTRLRAIARSQGARATRYQGATLLVQGKAGAATGLVFPDAGIVVVGDLAAVQSMLARDAGCMDKQLRAQADRMSGTNDVWFATVLSGRLLGQQLGTVIPQLRNSEALQTIAQSAGGIQFASRTVTINLDLIAGSVREAQSLSSLLSLASAFTGMSPGAASGSLMLVALHSMQVVTDGATIHAKAELAETQVEQALAAKRRWTADRRQSSQ